jgi:hypothetical protein
MIGRDLFKRISGRRSADQQRLLLTGEYRQKPEPPDLRAGVFVMGLALVLGLGVLFQVLSTESGGVAFMFLFACEFFCLGSFLLLLAVGRHVANRLGGVKKHCGSCRHFAVPSGLYVIGHCQADPTRRMVSRVDVCPTYCFSERALVRDRLGQQPGALKQIRITRLSDTAPRS